MNHPNALALALIGVITSAPLVVPGQARPQQPNQKPVVELPKPGVPEIMTLEGEYVRAAYNNEGYVILGYRIANHSVGEEWLMLEMGTTLREGRPYYKLTRDAITLEIPSGKTIPLASNQEYNAANLMALEQRERVMRDSINYFPPMASQGCRIGFFAELGKPGMVWNEVELSPTRACLGRLFFKVPGGIAYGQHWLNVQFQASLVRTPFRILTKDEEKFLSKNWKDIRKQVEDAFKKKK
jgi:hypothetical protein